MLINEARGISRMLPDPLSRKWGLGTRLGTEEVGHAYGPARNSVSRMVDQREDGFRSAFLYLPCRAH